MNPGGVPTVSAVSDGRGPGSEAGRGTDAQGARMMEHMAMTAAAARSVDPAPVAPSGPNG